jgi:hypothetical protein
LSIEILADFDLIFDLFAVISPATCAAIPLGLVPKIASK